MIQKLTIAEKPLPKEVEETLNVSEYEAWFAKQNYYKTGQYCPMTYEVILPCNIKLSKPRIDATILIEINSEALEWLKEIDEWRCEMNSPEILAQREVFEKTKVCPGHVWLYPNPMETAFGKLVLKNCGICRTAQVTIEGKTYENEVMKLLSWVAHESIKKEQEKKDIMGMMAQIGLKENKIDVPVSDLFKKPLTFPTVEQKSAEGIAKLFR